ncbi:Type 1 glutamine amidotransferase-like domain-containing protein [Microbacterium sp. EST19A]|uniref:Type 1 glutamine amidotransferase-like domain-containing protein n=1 Tax=Microbacterium sp. EST19A TaxID=2862681 RepID=UPI001CBC2923|nr:Type 1 glutamine amidotransferase-like domain-containing protein [Microbacterium sp. EST19A]
MDAPRVHVLLVLEPDDEESVDRYRGLVESAGAEPVVHAIVEGEIFDLVAIDSADGVFVGGGLTPAYHAAFTTIAPRVRERVASGMPYLGFSAGSAIAAAAAILGGYLLDGVAVCDEDAGEELDDVTVAPGLALVPFAVDVHAAQWGTVSRLIAAVDAGLVTTGVAIDEDTVVRWRAGEPATVPSVFGKGAAWQVTVADGAGSTGMVVNRRQEMPPTGG